MGTEVYPSMLDFQPIRFHLARGVAVAALAVLQVVLAAVPVGEALAATRAIGCSATRLVGTVIVVRGTTSVPVAPGTKFGDGDLIVTGHGARLRITCADGATVTVGEQTNVSLATLQAGAGGSGGTAVWDLVVGILRVTLSGRMPWQRFEVTTRTAVASARSTDWIVDAMHDKTAVLVVKGAVGVSGQATPGEVLLRAGDGTDIALGAAPTAPAQWKQPRVEATLARTVFPKRRP